MVAFYKVIKIICIVLKVLLVLTSVVLIVPFIFFTHPHALIATIVQSNAYLDKSPEPADYDLEGVNFYVESSTSLVPVWHLYPKGFKNITELKNQSTKLMVYVHGASLSRTRRIETYKRPLAAGFHLIIPELRGFNDAPGPFTGYGVEEDLMAVHRWFVSAFPNKKAIWWCFSLGNGICLQAISHLKSHRPAGVILEAPFSSMREMLLSRTSFRVLAGWFPLLTDAIINKIEKKYGIIPDIPVLHVMAEDDLTISYKKHFAEIKNLMKDQFVKKKRTAAYFPVSIPGCRGLGHYPISSGKAEDILQLMTHFWEEVLQPGIYTNGTKKIEPGGNGNTKTKEQEMIQMEKNGETTVESMAADKNKSVMEK